MRVDVAVGTILSGYRIERLLGRGGTGAVYLAHDEHLDRPVALKVLPHELSQDERFRARFLRESRVAARLEHPSIVPIYSAGEADGLLFLAMRFVEGGDLRTMLEREGRLEPEHALRILRPIAEALDAAHAGGLIHRDVKPGNILVGTEGRSYLADFGLAKHAATLHSLSRESVFSGTVDYVAPEQIQGEDVDGRADTYALACVLFEVLAGRPPFQRDSDLAVVFAHLKQAPPSLSMLRPELPEGLDIVLARGMAKNPDGRPRTAAELIADAGTVIGGREIERETGVAQLRTFMITDVRGYTRYTQQHGDEAAARLASRFAELVSSTVRNHDGRLIELRGDEALVVFESARNALRAALAMQAAVEREDMARGIGIGLDAGEAVPVGKGYRGGALNMAARLCALAEPGEVLASDAVVHLARKVEGVRYLQGRLERLKGIERPVRIVEVVPPERAVARVRAIRRRLHGRRWPAVLGAVAVAVGAIVALLALQVGGSASQLSSLQTVAVFSTEGRYLAGVPTGVDTYDEKYAAGAVWSLNGGGIVAKIDPRTYRIDLPVSIGDDRGWTVGGGAVWVDAADTSVVRRVDAHYGSVTTLKLPTAGLDGGDPRGQAVAYGDGSLWVAQNGGSSIARIDPATGALKHRIPVNGIDLLRFGDGALYAISQDSGDFWKIDPTSNSASWSAHIHPWIADVLPAGGVLWITVDSDAGVYRFNEGDGSEAGFTHTGDGSGALAQGGSHVWVSNSRAGTVSRIDPVNFRVQTFPTGNAPTGLAVTPSGRLFVGIAPRPPDVGSSLHGSVAHFVMREDWLDPVDPGSGWAFRDWELEYATEAKLYNYPDWSGTDPAQVVPEIAGGDPAASHRGRLWTYSISIRPGYRFSPPSNAPVTAAAMRYSIERAVSPAYHEGSPPGQGFLGVCDPAQNPQCTWHIVGSQAFLAGRSPHLAGLSATGSTLVIKTNGPVPQLAERLAMPFFSAVPIATPLAKFDPASHPIPSAGPYYVVYQNTGWQTVVRRNPNYAGPRPRSLDAIVYDVGINTGPAAARVIAGKLDYESESYPDYGALAPSGAIAARYGVVPRPSGRPWYSSLMGPEMDWLQMNTAHGLFASLAARRAVDLAVDRPALAALSGGIPQEQYLPPAMMGAPSASIVAPTPADLARARELLGHRHATVTLQIGQQAFYRQAAVIIRDDLARIGLRVRIDAVTDQYSPDARTGVDMRMYGWLFDFYDPSNLLTVNLFTDDPALNPFGFASSRWARANATADRLTGSARLAAFARVARGLRRSELPWVVLESRAQPAFFSARLGCIRTPPAYGGIDFAALCLNH